MANKKVRKCETCGGSGKVRKNKPFCLIERGMDDYSFGFCNTKEVMNEECAKCCEHKNNKHLIEYIPCPDCCQPAGDVAKVLEIKGYSCDDCGFDCAEIVKAPCREFLVRYGKQLQAIIESQRQEIEMLEKRRGGECEKCGSWVCPPLICMSCLAGVNKTSKLRTVNTELTNKNIQLQAQIKSLKRTLEHQGGVKIGQDAGIAELKRRIGQLEEKLHNRKLRIIELEGGIEHALEISSPHSTLATEALSKALGSEKKEGE